LKSQRRRRAKKKPGRKRRRDELEEDTDAEQERIEKLGAWADRAERPLLPVHTWRRTMECRAVEESASTGTGIEKKPGRKRRRDELEEDTDAEQERIEKLGAWVQCGVWCVF
jgi:hypothetical protein